MAKTYKHLFSQIVASSNLYLAHSNASYGKKKRASMVAFEKNIRAEVRQLQDELEGKTYCPAPHYHFYIYEPKKRLISASAYRDRVVHHALCNVIQPIFENSLIFDTYANRVGKGTHKAIQRCQDFLRKNTYYLKADIRQYFPSIDHAILKQHIRQKIACPDTLWLIDLIIESYHTTEGKGLPIGNLTSQYFANTYLNGFDHFVKEDLKCVHYLRYVDDFVVFSQDKTRLHEIKDAIETYLHTRLGLCLQPQKTKIAQTKEGITFLGQRIFNDYRLLKKERLRSFCKKLTKKVDLWHKKQLSFEKLRSSLNAWLGHAKHADTYGLQKQIKAMIMTENQ